MTTSVQPESPLPARYVEAKLKRDAFMQNIADWLGAPLATVEHTPVAVLAALHVKITELKEIDRVLAFSGIDVSVSGGE